MTRTAPDWAEFAEEKKREHRDACGASEKDFLKNEMIRVNLRHSLGLPPSVIRGYSWLSRRFACADAMRGIN